ncbi:symmetrical bis(5'-nucleosyl)-tetraphosphatase [Shewanella violacea]|uniref:bis(5'-nucleosyl)-tetraphosphatase (symmetrical) n=1 Tax=Shewanella violacea (strain JCM 10179 / CIP 106290 / LMG 19151 / DSS12) TaxID=637905 RepID=D4ZGG7_SHEVD|nr:symmetrical bis(5'-nucleosyl)-tetraphosphatase [Shewanella violacea]BAJ00766.1 bis(5'-nucleosyl)-tetraphosphatase [symmetrical] [Shewanella violacea DSS12]
MANYFVGDIQGCFEELELVLAKVDFNPSTDVLWAVGDLIARGEGSLPTLRYFKQLDGSAKVVLGNHDLHLMAVAAKIKRVNPKDQLDALLDAADLGSLIGWLRLQPLVQELPEQNIIMTHAGVPPQWDIQTLRAQAQLVSKALTSQDYIPALIAKMYTNKTHVWDENASELQRQIYCINALTRMRFLRPDGGLDFDCKLSPDDCQDPSLTPWFNANGLIKETHTLIFGHWAAVMGKVENPNIYALDTGCCWGNHLTLWHMESDQKITQNKLKKS